MNLFLLLLSSALLGLVYYFSLIRMPADLRKSYLLLSGYRFVFFGIQSLFFYFLYDNATDSFVYHHALEELAVCFKQYPADCIEFFKSDYAELHISAGLKEYLYTEIRVTFFLKVVLPFFLLSVQNYYLTGMWLTFIGSICFMPFLSLHKKADTFLIWLLVLLIPSFTFWTVGILKEALVLPILFLLFYLLHSIIETKGEQIQSVLLFIVCMFIAWNIKYYLVALFCFVSMMYYVITYVRLSKFSVLISIVVLILGGIGLGHLHPAFHWKNFPEVVYISNHLTCTKYIQAYSCIPFDLDISWTSIFLNFPKAIVYAFFSPFPWQIHNVSSLFAAIEGYLFILLLVLTCYKYYTGKVIVPVKAWIVLLFILLAGGLLLLAAPNIGSFSRYRIFYLPLYGFIVFYYSGIMQSKASEQIKQYLGLKSA
ncbi:MAG: hypothetical protein ACTHJT_07630 [Cytophaga sp.]|uniref:hypothetical protein n=1 Tax=Cytophaga sp. TaxID=29535 RepID=UPI003F7D438C